MRFTKQMINEQMMHTPTKMSHESPFQRSWLGSFENELPFDDSTDSPFSCPCMLLSNKLSAAVGNLVGSLLVGNLVGGLDGYLVGGTLGGKLRGFVVGFWLGFFE